MPVWILATAKQRKERMQSLSKWLSREISDLNFMQKNLGSYQPFNQYDFDDIIHRFIVREVKKRYGFSTVTASDYAKIISAQNTELIKKAYAKSREVIP